MFDNSGHIFHTTVADLKAIFDENLVELVFLWEVLVDELQQHFRDISLGAFAVWKIEPDYFSFSALFSQVVSIPCCIYKFFVVYTVY